VHCAGHLNVLMICGLKMTCLLSRTRFPFFLFAQVVVSQSAASRQGDGESVDGSRVPSALDRKKQRIKHSHLVPRLYTITHAHVCVKQALYRPVRTRAHPHHHIIYSVQGYCTRPIIRTMEKDYRTIDFYASKKTPVRTVRRVRLWAEGYINTC